MNKQVKEKGRKLTYLLRHNPKGLNISKDGYVKTDIILKKLDLSFEALNQIVDNDNKGRFGFKDNKSFIRANQGHSIDIDLGLEAVEPPDILFHGTTSQSYALIKKTGIKKMARHHVHLSEDLATARQVAYRRSKDIILLKIEAKKTI